MRKIVLFASLFVLVIMAGCQSAESKEIIAYHNGYIENVEDKIDELYDLIDELWEMEIDEEATKLMDDELEPKINQIKKYMEDQNPEKEDTKAYHKLRGDSIMMLAESMELTLEAFRGILDESLSDEQIEELLDKSFEKNDEAVDMGELANDKIDELAEKHNLEEENKK